MWFFKQKNNQPYNYKRILKREEKNKLRINCFVVLFKSSNINMFIYIYYYFISVLNNNY